MLLKKCLRPVNPVEPRRAAGGLSGIFSNDIHENESQKQFQSISFRFTSYQDYRHFLNFDSLPFLIFIPLLNEY